MHHRLWTSGILVCVVGLLSFSTAYADGMRCGTKLVSDGDSTFDVHSVCGAPDAASQRSELRTVRTYVNGPCFQDQGVIRCGRIEERVIQVTIDEWIYDFGPHNLVRYLTFEQGRLYRVATGGYGNKQ
jgi:hypothetical protein